MNSREQYANLLTRSFNIPASPHSRLMHAKRAIAEAICYVEAFGEVEGHLFSINEIEKIAELAATLTQKVDSAKVTLKRNAEELARRKEERELMSMSARTLKTRIKRLKEWITDERYPDYLTSQKRNLVRFEQRLAELTEAARG